MLVKILKVYPCSDYMAIVQKWPLEKLAFTCIMGSLVKCEFSRAS